MNSDFHKVIIACITTLLVFSCQTEKEFKKPNVIFVLMDDLGYGQFGMHNDTLKTTDFDPYFVHLVDSLEHYSLESALEYSKKSIPTISKLAKNGVLFTNAFASSSLCAPSRVGMATGILPNRFGIYRNIDAEERGIDSGRHLAEKMNDLGYKTAHIGKWHIGRHDDHMVREYLEKNGVSDTLTIPKVRKLHPDIYKQLIKNGYQGSTIQEHHPLSHGFDYYYGYNYWASQFYNDTNVWENNEHAGIQSEYNTDTFTDKALNFIKKQVIEEEPFYVQLHYHAVHDSLEPMAPPKYYNRFTSQSKDLNNFYAHIYGVDQGMKRIIDSLKSMKVYKNTMIVFTSDNGAMTGGSYDGHKTGSPLPGNAPFSGHKGNYYQGGVRVPLFVHWPNGIQNPYKSEHLASTMDIIPTAIDAAGGKVPFGIDGRSLLSILSNQKAPQVHDQLFWAGVQSNRWGHTITKTTKNHSNEANFAPAAWAITKGDYLLRFIGTLEKGVYKEYIDGRKPVYELYNIKSDPQETNDVSRVMPEKVNELAKIYFNKSNNFKPPVKWDKTKWEELRKPFPELNKAIFKD